MQKIEDLKNNVMSDVENIMASSPAKRRKLSPESIIPTTPSRIPVRREKPQSASERRPSFASPTKASIARHNPQLLARRLSTADNNARTPSRGNAPGVLSEGLTETVRGEASTLLARGNQSQEKGLNQGSQTPTARTPSNGMRETRSAKGGMASAPKRLPRTPAKAPVGQEPDTVPDIPGVTVPAPVDFNPFKRAGLRRSPTGSQSQVSAGVEAEPREEPTVSADIQETAEAEVESVIPESSAKGSPTPPPVAEAEITQTLAREPNESKPRIQQPSVTEPPTIEPQNNEPEPTTSSLSEPSAITSSFPSVVPRPSISRLPATTAEPDLPPTPVQRGIADPVVTTPPSGIHNASSQKAKSKLRDSVPSSPLKNKAYARDESRTRIEQQTQTSTTRPSQPEPARTQIPSVSKDPVVVEEQKPASYPARPVDPVDPLAEKKSYRDELLDEIRQLQLDVKIAERESERIRNLQDSKTSSTALPTTKDDLIDILLRTTGQRADDEAPKTPPSVFTSINLFLPFSAKPRPKRQITPPIYPPKSHEPLPTDDPLPYLQVFSPLTYTSTTYLLPPTPGSSSSGSIPSTALLRQHRIIASSPTGLFSARLEMITNTTTLSITSLSIPAISPEAEYELGPWARERARAGVLGRDISTICWAMGRWVEVAVKRAEFWLSLQDELRDGDKRQQMVERLRKRGKRKRGADEEVNEDNEDRGDELASEIPVSKSNKSSRKQLLPLIGKQNMVIPIDSIELMFTWSITFDWTGEPSSAISASARLPESCKSHCT